MRRSVSNATRPLGWARAPSVRRRLGIVLGIVAILPAGASLARAETFKTLFDTCLHPPCELSPIGTALGQAVARSIPVLAASPGLTFTYDEATGAFVRRPSVAGQLFLERADPLGRGRWNVSLSYQYVAIDSIDGVNVHHLHDSTPIKGTFDTFFTIPSASIDLVTDQQTLSVTYGLGDDTDLNLTVPVLYSDLEFSARFASGGSEATPFRHAASKFGVGDIFVRGKQRVLHRDAGSLAFEVALRLPSGSEGDFQGTGSVEVLPTVVATTAPLFAAPWLAFQGYVNAGLDFVTGDLQESEGRYGLGVDARLWERGTLAIAFLARQGFDTPPGSIYVTRQGGGSAPLFGLHLDRVNEFDFSIGGRVVLWRDLLIAYANVLLPLNDEGVRSDVIPLAGLELAF